MLRFSLRSCPSPSSAAKIMTASSSSSISVFSFAFSSTKVTFSGCRKMEHFAARQFGFVSRLSVAAPRVASEWDYEKNPTRFFPDIISTATMQPFWWKCQKCQESFCMSPERRTVRGRGCPKCEHLPNENVDEEIETSKKKKTTTRTNSSSRKSGKDNNNNRKKKKKRKEDSSPLEGELNPKLRATRTSGKATYASSH